MERGIDIAWQIPLTKALIINLQDDSSLVNVETWLVALLQRSIGFKRRRAVWVVELGSLSKEKVLDYLQYECQS